MNMVWTVVRFSFLALLFIALAKGVLPVLLSLGRCLIAWFDHIGNIFTIL